jgi:hypothetical protein
MTEIRFLTNEARKIEGLAYAGFETFKGSPYTSCARETGQNSRDAASSAGTVKVSFDLLELQRQQVPFADHMQHSIECCLKAPQDEKTSAFLHRAHQKISDRTIKVLRISDVNTTGLTGPVDDAKSVFTALVKGDGVTNKPDPTSAGSYGIGKNAAYAVSDLQTVVYSTRYPEKDSGKTRFAAQGRLRLISHTDADKEFSAEGYWGGPNFVAIEDESSVPDWIARDDIGTSIFAIGFSEQEKWIDRMALSLATNFFLAVDREEIEFSLQSGTVRINRSSLDDILGSETIRQSAEANDEVAQLVRSKKLLQCVRSDATQRYPITVRGLGEFTLHLLVAEDLPREIHILRNGIYICDNFAKFGEPLKRFPGTRDFIAILEPARNEAGKQPSKLLKQLENPAHGAFEPERIVDQKDLLAAKAQIKQLIKQVRDIIKTSAKIEDLDQSQLEELSHLFASGGAGTLASDQNAEADPDRFKYGVAEARHQHSPAPGVGKRGKASRPLGSNTERPPGTPAQPERPKVTRPLGSRSVIPLEDVRTILSKRDDYRIRTIFFTPAATGEAEIEILAAGLSDDVVLPVSAQSSGTVVNGRPRTTLTDGLRTRIDLTFVEPYIGPIEISATSVLNPMTSEEA